MIYKGLSILILAISLLIPNLSDADDLHCFASGEAVPGAFIKFTGTATSVTAGVTDKDDAMASPYATPTMTDRGSNVWTAADFTAGSTVGLHKIRMTGTVNGQTEEAFDTFVVKAQCPLTPTVAGRQLQVNTNNQGAADLAAVNGTTLHTPDQAGYVPATGSFGIGPGQWDVQSGIQTSWADVKFRGTLTSQAGAGTNQVILPSGAATADNAYQFGILMAISGTHIYEQRGIIRYIGSSKILVLDAPFSLASGDQVIVSKGMRPYGMIYAAVVDASPAPTSTCFSSAGTFTESSSKFYLGWLVIEPAGQPHRIDRFDPATDNVCVQEAYPFSVTPASGATMMVIQANP